MPKFLPGFSEPDASAQGEVLPLHAIAFLAPVAKKR